MPKKVIGKMDEFKSSDALDAIFTLLRRTNKYIMKQCHGRLLKMKQKGIV